MSTRKRPVRPWRLSGAVALAGLVAALAACAGRRPPVPPAAAGGAGTAAVTGSTTPAPAGTQSPVPAESNPPGDIPDTTIYVTYRSAPGHLLLKVPEGWSRKTGPASSTFTSN